MSKANRPGFELPRRAMLVLLACAAMLPGAAALGASAPQLPIERIPVVATFSILGDMAQEVGGDYVSVTTIVGPNGDAHTYEPTPRDVKALADAKVLVLNGLDFEGWLPRLLAASGFGGRQVLASQGVEVRHLGNGEVVQIKGDAADGHDHGHASGEAHGHRAGDVDPHAWQNLANGVLYARNIAAGLAQVDPRHADYYNTRANLYIARMNKLDAEIKNAFGAIAPDRRTVITSHDAFGYFGQAYGIKFISLAGFSSDAEPTARDVAAIVDMARRQRVAGVFVENVNNPKLARQIARETGATVGGTLYSDALAPAGEPAGTYLGMFSWNAGRLIHVLNPKAR
jgi:zinc/manganese transport system substrate-binding protein